MSDNLSLSGSMAIIAVVIISMVIVFCMALSILFGMSDNSGSAHQDKAVEFDISNVN